MARDVDDVIYAAGDPVVAIFVSAATVTGEVEAFVLLKVGFFKAFVIAIDGAHLSRPGF